MSSGLVGKGHHLRLCGTGKEYEMPVRVETRGSASVRVCVCALYLDEVDPCAALGWTPHLAQVC